MQAFFLDNFPPIQLNLSCQFLSFLEFWLEFFHEFLGIFQKSAGIFKFLKIFDDKKADFRSTF